MQDVQERFEHLLADPTEVDKLLAALSKVPVFAPLSGLELRSVLKVGRMVVYAAREVVFEQDSEGSSLHVVLEGGPVQLVRMVPKVGARLLALSGSGSSFGEVAFLTGARRTLRAMVADAECLQLVIDRKGFDEALLDNPAIGTRIYQGIVLGIHERLEHLPVYFRNYVMWGYAPPTDPGDRQEAPEVVRRWLVFPIVGALVGAAVALLLLYLGQRQWPKYSMLWRDAHAPALRAAVLAMAAGGFLVGCVTDWLADRARRTRRSVRSCMNCHFVVFDEGSPAFDCVYRLEEMAHIPIRKGATYDSFTDCPSFQLKPRGPRP